MVLFLFEGVGVPRVQLGAQVRLGFTGSRGVAVVLFFASGDGCVVASLIASGAVTLEAERAQDQEAGQHDQAGQDAFGAAHAATSGSSSYCHMRRPPMTAISVSTYFGSVA